LGQSLLDLTGLLKVSAAKVPEIKLMSATTADLHP
jgi:hypothetical protein